MLNPAEQLIVDVARAIEQRDALQTKLLAALTEAEAARDGYLAHLTASQGELARERERAKHAEKTP